MYVTFLAKSSTGHPMRMDASEMLDNSLIPRSRTTAAIPTIRSRVINHEHKLNWDAPSSPRTRLAAYILRYCAFEWEFHRISWEDAFVRWRCVLAREIEREKKRRKNRRRQRPRRSEPVEVSTLRKFIVASSTTVKHVERYTSPKCFAILQKNL